MDVFSWFMRGCEKKTRLYAISHQVSAKFPMIYATYIVMANIYERYLGRKSFRNIVQVTKNVLNIVNIDGTSYNLEMEQKPQKVNQEVVVWKLYQSF